MGARFAAAGLLTTPACIFCDASEDANRAYLAGREGRNSLSKSSTPPTITKNPAIYRYLVDHSLQTTPDQAALQASIDSLPLARLAGSPDEAQFFQVLLRAMGAKRVIEGGVFRGYTTLAMALAVPPDGEIVALDTNRDFCRTAAPYWRAAGVEHKIVLMIDPATTSLDTLLARGEAGSYDFVFIDADKPNCELLATLH